jgi:hypothetical protein
VAHYEQFRAPSTSQHRTIVGNVNNSGIVSNSGS